MINLNYIRYFLLIEKLLNINIEICHGKQVAWQGTWSGEVPALPLRFACQGITLARFLAQHDK